jgi:hypothetical protein
MIFDGKPVDETSDTEIASVVVNSVQENQHPDQRHEGKVNLRASRGRQEEA